VGLGALIKESTRSLTSFLDEEIGYHELPLCIDNAKDLLLKSPSLPEPVTLSVRPLHVEVQPASPSSLLAPSLLYLPYLSVSEL
jgi:hypothetical protein